MSKFILIGADPNSLVKTNPGGQATACLGLVSFLNISNHSVEIIDTTQSSFPIPNLLTRVFKGVKRTIQLITKLSFSRYEGVIIFSSSGFSFYERIFQSMVCRVFNVTSVLCVRSGHFMNDVNRSEKYRKRVEWLLRFPKYLAVQGEPWYDFFKELGKPEDKILMFRNWLPESFPITEQPKGLENEVIRFIFVGWLVEEKGIKELLEATELLTKMGKQFNLEVVGGGHLDKYVDDFIKDKNLQSKATKRGWLSKDDIINTLQDGHVFILPSKAEGFPNAMLEAMSLGLPAIVSDVGAVRDSLKNNVNGVLLKHVDVESIVDAMLVYIENPSKVKEHSLNTIKIVKENHSANENCKSLLSVFKI